MEDKQQSIIDLAIYIAALVALGLLGGLARELVYWSLAPRTWSALAGGMATSVLAAVVAGMLARDLLPHYPHMAFATAGLAAWAGNAVLDSLAKVVRHKLEKMLDD